MCENKEVVLNDVDMKAVFATWIIANNGCGDLARIDCAGKTGLFKWTECPLFGRPGGCGSSESAVIRLKAWLENYHQHKTEAAEAERRKAEAAKKEEQEAKRTCGECQHIYDTDGLIEIGLASTTLCYKKSIRVPIEFTGCGDFEPMADSRMTLQCQHSASKSGVDAAAYAERIAHLEKENANLSAKYERLTEQRNKLANDLIEQRNRFVKATRRLEDAGKENSYLRNESKMYSETVVMLTEKIKHLEERLSERKQSWPPRLTYCLAIS
jgi:hypothetical protein